MNTDDAPSVSDQSGESDRSVTTVEWGIVIDDLGSADMADSEAEARDWLANGQGLSLVRVSVTEWPRVNDPRIPPGLPAAPSQPTAGTSDTEVGG